MKKTAFILCLMPLALTAQQSADEIFLRFNSAVQDLRKVEYTRIFEIINPAENYFHKDTSVLYTEFDKNYPADILRYMRTGPRFKRIYTPENQISLDTDEKQYEVENGGVADARVYHSLLDLRVGLPKIPWEEGTVKTVNDTVILGKKYYYLTVKLPAGRNMSFPEGLGTLGIKTLVSMYSFVLDPETYLPYLLVYRNSNDPDYCVKSYYLGLNLQPHGPEPAEWTLAGYPDYRQKVKVPQKPFVRVGEPFPDWELPVFHPQKTGETLSLDAVKGKLTVIEFWVKNCGYCQEAFKDMKQLSEKYKNKPLNIISINMEDTDTLNDFEFIYNKHQPVYTMLYQGSALAKQAGVYSFPRTIVLNENGEVILHETGFSFEKVDGFLGKYF